MAPVIVPVGLTMGQDFAESTPEYWQLHLGDELVQLDTEEVVAWQAAFTDPQEYDAGGIDRAGLAARVLELDHEVADPARVVSRLSHRGLLIELDPVDGPLEEAFRGLQLFPLARGMGNTVGNPDRYRIGLAGEPLVEVGPNVYAIWSYALTEPSLWNACAGLAAGLDEDLEPGERPYDLNAGDIAADVAAALPMLVASGCAFLDPVAPRNERA